MTIQCNFAKDGSFSLQYGGIRIDGCYPGVDNMPIHPLSVKVEQYEGGGAAIYTTLNGTIELTVVPHEDGLCIDSQIRGFREAPHTFHPIIRGLIPGLQGIYRQGFGIAGPSGFCKLDDVRQEGGAGVDSHGLIVFAGVNENLCMFTTDHKRFVNSFNTRLEYRYHDTLFCGAAFRLENTVTDVVLPSLYIVGSNELADVLSDAAEKIGSKAELTKPPLYSWCSWYYCYHNFDMELLEEYAAAFAKERNNSPIQYIQIDAGYFTAAGDWLTHNHLWPGGMEAAARVIKSHGFAPGIWIAPYMVSNRSRIFHDHPDWLLYKKDGSLVTEWRMYHEYSVWGYPDEEYYVLDTSHPDALAYIRSVFCQFKSWGYDLYKTDFMLWGHHDSSNLKRYVGGKTSVEYFIELLDVIREEIGDSYWLGCIAPFYEMIGYVDGMRIAGDVGAEWDKNGRAQKHLLREIIGDNYFNNVYWQNDPDALIIRNIHSFLTQGELEALALLQATSGGAVYTSDPLHKLNKNCADLFSFVYPDAPVTPTVYDITNMDKEVLFTHDLGDGKFLLYFFNVHDQSIKTFYKLEDVIGEAVYLHLWNTGEYTNGKQDVLLLDMERRSGRLYFASTQNAISNKPNNLWKW